MADQDGGLTSEGKVTIGSAGVGFIAILLQLVKDQKTNGYSDAILITMMCCVTAIVMSFVISRGMAKYEYRGLPPNTMPPPQHG